MYSTIKTKAPVVRPYFYSFFSNKELAEGAAAAFSIFWFFYEHCTPETNFLEQSAGKYRQCKQFAQCTLKVGLLCTLQVRI